MTNPAPLHPGQYYHLYNRGNNRENVFREERNYAYFLRLYAQHVEPVAETYAYCLLRNHFHFLVRIRDEEHLTGLRQTFGLHDLSGVKPQRFVSQQFSNFFNAYARAFNKACERTGALFERPFGRVPVTTNAHLIYLVTYIHRNPQKHGFVTDFREWPHSSYHSLLSVKATQLNRETVLGWFEGQPQFEKTHRQWAEKPELAALAPDDFD